MKKIKALESSPETLEAKPEPPKKEHTQTSKDSRRKERGEDETNEKGRRQEKERGSQESLKRKGHEDPTVDRKGRKRGTD